MKDVANRDDVSDANERLALAWSIIGEPVWLLELGRLVGKTSAMRKAQVAYFKDRTQENLVTAKVLEKEMDGLLEKLGIRSI